MSAVKKSGWKGHHVSFSSERKALARKESFSVGWNGASTGKSPKSKESEAMLASSGSIKSMCCSLDVVCSGMFVGNVEMAGLLAASSDTSRRLFRRLRLVDWEDGARFFCSASSISRIMSLSNA